MADVDEARRQRRLAALRARGKDRLEALRQVTGGTAPVVADADPASGVAAAAAPAPVPSRPTPARDPSRMAAEDMLGPAAGVAALSDEQLQANLMQMLMASQGGAVPGGSGSNNPFLRLAAEMQAADSAAGEAPGSSMAATGPFIVPKVRSALRGVLTLVVFLTAATHNVCTLADQPWLCPPPVLTDVAWLLLLGPVLVETAVQVWRMFGARSMVSLGLAALSLFQAVFVDWVRGDFAFAVFAAAVAGQLPARWLLGLPEAADLHASIEEEVVEIL